MARGDLILRIGADAGPLKKALAQLNNSLVKAGNKLESIGRSLSLRVSAPIAAAGVASVAAFAEFQKLEKSLQAVSGSSKEAEATLSRLRKLALEPGIDLKNAVTGSIRLQAVGFAAQEAEGLILQFSKAVTLAGGTGEDLGEVVRQITQIISKGKILSSDFRVIQERVPAIGIALKNAFGTTNIEQIRETGISATDFVNRLTDGIRVGKEFQNVQGGLSNSFNNFQQSIQASLVVLGETIVESIDLENKLDFLANTITDLINAFASLSPQTKTIILSVAGLAAALGPLSFGLGALLKILPLVRTGLVALTGPIGLIGVAIGLAAAAFLKFNNQASAFEQAQERVNNVTKEAAELADAERESVNKLIGVIRSETTTKGEKAQAIEELKRISPDYFKNLDVERIKTNELTKASDSYNLSLAQRFELQKIEEEEARIKEQLAEEQNKLNRSTSLGSTILAALGGNLAAYASGVSQTAKETKTLSEELKLLDERRKALLDGSISTPEQTKPSFTPTVSSGDKGPARGLIADFKALGDAFDDPNKKLGELQEKLIDISNEVATNSFAKLLSDDFKSLSNGLTTTVSAVTEYGNNVESLELRNELLGGTFDVLQEKLNLAKEGFNAAFASGNFSDIEFFRDKIQELTEQLEEQRKVLEATAAASDAFASAFNSASKSQEEGFKAVGRAALGAASQVVKAKLLEATASFFADAFAKFGIFGAILAAGAGAVVGGLFSKVASSLNIPALAAGGIVSKPTLALIGEAGPEAVVPLSRPNRFLDNAGQQELTARIAGEDLLFLIQRVQKSQNRLF